jgi:ribosomal protein S3AE
MVSSGLLRRVALVRTDVSEETGASFIRVTKIGELGTTQAATSNRRTLRRNTEDTILHSHRRENLKSYMKNAVFWDINHSLYLTENLLRLSTEHSWLIQRKI